MPHFIKRKKKCPYGINSIMVVRAVDDDFTTKSCTGESSVHSERLSRQRQLVIDKQLAGLLMLLKQ